MSEPRIITEQDKETLKQSPVRRLGRYIHFLAGSIAVLFLSGLVASWYLFNLNQASAQFPVSQQIVIEPGTSVKEITEIFEEKSVVKSGLLLYYALLTLHEPTAVKASTYVFEAPLTTLQVAHRLTEGDFDTDLISLTHFEGERAALLGERAAALLPNVSAEEFVALAEPAEGTLFPDTYFVPPTFTTEELFTLLTKTFAQKLTALQSDINNHNLTLAEVLVLASIIEREANTPESKKMVSGILQNRLSINMPLQADASIEYILDKPLSELTPSDLTIDSPYNTYLNQGLPPTPIGNPGLDAIQAVLEPTESEYFYYITGNDGVFYYAETYQQHLINIEQHLR